MGLWRTLTRGLRAGELSTTHGKVKFAADIVATQAGFMAGSMLPGPQPHLTLIGGAVAPALIESAFVGYVESIGKIDRDAIAARIDLLRNTSTEISYAVHYNPYIPIKHWFYSRIHRVSESPVRSFHDEDEF